MSGADDKADKNTADETSFGSRWSRRKQRVTERRSTDVRPEVQQSAEAGPAIPLSTIVPDGSVGGMQTRTEADRLAEENVTTDAIPVPLTDDDMPAIETLDEGSDFSGFMSPGVSEKLRKIALRKLFTGAGFNVRDGLDDYDDDFTSFEPLGDLVTCDMKHRAEMQAEKKAKEEQEELERLAAGEDTQETAQEAPREEIDHDDDVATESAEHESEAKAKAEANGEADDNVDERHSDIAESDPAEDGRKS